MSGRQCNGTMYLKTPHYELTPAIGESYNVDRPACLLMTSDF